MDDSRRTLTWSIRTRLAARLAAVIAVLAAVAGLTSYFYAYRESYELQDDQLMQVAHLAAGGWLAMPGSFVEGAPRHDDAIAVRWLDRSGVAMSSDPDLNLLPPDLPPGRYTQVLGANQWQVMIWQAPHAGRIAVAQLTSVRDEAAVDSALFTVIPLLSLLPLIWLVIHIVSRATIEPITRLAESVDKRGKDNLAGLPEGDAPVEVLPFIAAINHMLDRLKRSIGQQRRFIVDAAHELRTPLTALRLQAENLDRAPNEAERRRRSEALMRGIGRAERIVEQLLGLARQSEPAQVVPEPISLTNVTRQVIQDCLVLAEAKRIELGMERSEAAWLMATPEAIYALVRNLTDNAIRYTPAGGQVLISTFTEAGAAVLRVADSGPGVPVEQRERVFEPFYRVPAGGGDGSGLGLTIVAEIARRQGGKIELAEGAQGGLVISYRQSAAAFSRQLPGFASPTGDSALLSAFGNSSRT